MSLFALALGCVISLSMSSHTFAYFQDKPEEKKEEQPQNPPPAQPNQPTQPPGGKVQIDPDTQKKIDDLMQQENAKKAEENKGGAKPAEDKNARRGSKAKTPAKGGAQPAAGAPNVPPVGMPDHGAMIANPALDAGPSATVNIPPDLVTDSSVPPEQRKYKFSIQDGTYEQLVQGIAHQTGLGVLGDVPKDGRLTFVTDQELSFDEMLNQVRTLLFDYKPLDPYTIYRTATGLKVIRVNDFLRKIQPERMFRSIEEFRTANVVPNELVFVIFTPTSGAISDLRQVRDFMPDYFRVAPMESSDDSNSVSLYGLASDIEKYLGLVKFFANEGGNDPRTVEPIRIEHILPSDAMNKLNSLMDLTGQPKQPGAGRAQRSATPDVLDTLPAPTVVVIPDDAMGVLLVRAMPDKIAEIKKLLPYIDVANGTSYPPVVIPVQHADPATLLSTIQQILAVTDVASSSGVPAMPPAAPAAPAAGGKPARKKAPRPATPVSTDSVTLLPHPAGNALIAIGSDEEVTHVRELVAKFDIADVVGPIRIPLTHRHAVEITTTLNNFFSGNSPKAAATPAPQLIADNSGTSFWFVGTERDLARTRELLPQIDIPVDDPPTLHTVRLKYQKASFVANMLREYDGADPAVAPQAAPGAPPKPRGKRRAPASTTASKFTADDDNNLLYILCTNEEWADYDQFIKSLDVPIGDPSEFTRLEIANIDPNEAIEQLRGIVGEDGPQGVIQYLVSGKSILVFNATDSDVKQMQTLLREIDRPTEIQSHTFEIKYADPGDLMAIIEKLVTGESSEPSAPRRRGGKRQGAAAPEGAPAPVTISSSSNGELTMIPHGNLLIVKTTPNKMKQVAEIIAEFDVEHNKQTIHVFDDFQPTTDINMISDTLESILGASGKHGKDEGKPGASAPQLIPQPSAHRLLVLADAEQFKEIEELLTVLRTSENVEIPEVAFIDLKHAEADKLVSDIEPILALRVNRMVMKGELPEAPKEDASPAATPEKAASKASTRKAKPRAVASSEPTSDRYHLAPAQGNKRIVVVAIPQLIEEVRTLVQKFDVPSGDAPVMRTIDLIYSNNIEMAKAVRELMGSTPRVVQTKDGGKESPMTSRIKGADEVLSIVEQPSGNGLVLYGPLVDVEQAIEWIKDLDAKAAQGRVIKVYRFEEADVEDVVDLVMNVVDVTPAAAAAPKRQPSKSSKGDEAEEDEDSESSFETSKTRVGTDLYIKADLMGNTMLVAASPAKIAHIDALVAQIEPKDEKGESILVKEKPIPKMIYELEFADGFDASLDLERALKLFWDNPDEVPDVDYQEIGEKQVLVVKHPDKDRFPEVEELIKKFADRLPEEDTKKTRKVFAMPPGINAKDAAERLRNSFPDMEIEIKDVSKPNDYGMEVLTPPTKKEESNTSASATNPCVLPLAFQRSIMQISLALQEDTEEEQSDEEKADKAERELVEAEQMRAMQQLAMNMMAQPEDKAKAKPEDKKDAKPEDKKSATDKDKKDETKRTKLPTDQPVKITYDPLQGTLIMEGPKLTVTEGEDILDEMGKEVEEIPPPPDIKIVRVRYIDLETAANILEEMFNTPRQQQQQMQNMMRIQQQAAAAAARQGQQQPGGRQPGQPGQDDENQPGGRGGQRGGQPNMPQIPQMPQMPTTSVRVYPNPRDRTLILRADTSQYPAIMELLATIDQPQPINSELRVFTLEKLNATEVETVLKEMLGLEAAGRGSRAQARRATPGGAPDGGGVVGGGTPGGGSNLPEQIMNQTVAGMLGIDTSHIKISSNAESNTILAMAPKAALDYIEKIIKELESHDAPPRDLEYFYLQHADPSELAEFLTTHFEESSTIGRSLRRGTREGAAPTAGGSSGRSLNAPTFTPYPRLNLLTAQATPEQMKEVKDQVAKLDVPSDFEKLYSVALAHADAKQVADTLSSLFAGTSPAPRETGRGSVGRASSGSSGPRFIGNEGEAIVFYSAPKGLLTEIEQRIKQLDEEAGKRSTPREIVLTKATPSKVADAIDAMYNGGRSASSRGSATPARVKSRFTITAHDPTKRLFVVADDKMFEEISDRAKMLDRDDTGIGATLRIYPLKYAGAKELLGKLTKMVTDYTSRLTPDQKSGLDAFSVEADEKTNSLVVLGGPAVFGFVEESLKLIDIPANAISGPGTLSMTLNNTDAAEVVQNLKNMFAGKQLGPGESVPSIEANKAGNMIIAKGTQGQMDEIKKFVEQLDTVDPNARQVVVVPIKNADASAVSRALGEIYVRSAPTRNNVPSISVSEIQGSRGVLVKASPTDLEKIKATIAELDSEKYSGGSEIRVVALKYADATELQTAAQAILAKAGGTGRGELMGGVRVGMLASSNAIVLSGDKAALDSLEVEVKQLDMQAGEQGVKPVLITLNKATVSKVMPTLNEMFLANAQRSGRAGQQPITITPNPAINGFLIQAPPRDMSAIQATIEAMDIDAVRAAPDFRIVQVASGVPVSQLASDVEQAVNDSAIAQAGRGGQRGDVTSVTLTADRRTNSIIIAGSGQLFDQAEEMIKTLEKMGPTGGTKTMVIPVTNTKAEELKTLIEELKRRASGEDSSGRSGGGGGRPRATPGRR